MKQFFFLLSVLASIGTMQAQQLGVETTCAEGKQAAFGRNTPSARIMANRGADTYDIHFYHIDLNVSNTSTTLSGNVLINSLVTSATLDTFWFELKDFMTIDSVVLNGVRRTNLIRANDVIRVPLAEPMTQGQEVSCRVYYNGTPASAGFFSGITSNNGATWTLSEPFSAPDWLPCKQDLWDKIDSVWFFATTNTGTKVGSNGLLTNVVALPNNKVRYEWKTNYKMAFYLIAFSVANYQEYLNYAHPAQLMGDSILIQHYIYNGSLAQNKVGLDRTPGMIEHYSEKIMLYPFYEEKYGHMQANLGGGMEHQTMSTMGGFSMDLTSHELAHQWFGDYVTCATWSDIWLNEGWASYMEYIYRESIGAASAASWLDASHSSARNAPTGSVYVPAGSSVNRIFNGNLTYEKGASVLHMLRYLIGDSLFFAATQEYLRIKGDTVSTTDEFRAVYEQVSGQSLQSFFNEWVYGEGFPTYQVRWNQIDSTLYVSVSQTTTTANPVAFSIPVPLMFSATGLGTQTIRVDPNVPVNVFQVNGTITTMQLDPNKSILKDLSSSIFRQNTLGVSVEELKWVNLKVYPNPNQGQFIIESDRDASYQLRDLQGRVLTTGTVQTGANEVHVSTPPAGIYLLQLNDGHSTHHERIVIR